MRTRRLWNVFLCLKWTLNIQWLHPRCVWTYVLLLVTCSVTFLCIYFASKTHLSETVLDSPYQSTHWHEANSSARLRCQLLYRNYADEIRCYVALHTSRGFEWTRKGRKKAYVVGMAKSVKEFAVIPHDTLFISDGVHELIFNSVDCRTFSGGLFLRKLWQPIIFHSGTPVICAHFFLIQYLIPGRVLLKKAAKTFC